MAWFEKNADKPKIPPAKALWAICPKCKDETVDVTQGCACVSVRK